MNRAATLLPPALPPFRRHDYGCDCTLCILRDSRTEPPPPPTRTTTKSTAVTIAPPRRKGKP